MRIGALALTLAGVAIVAVASQSTIDAELEAQLKQFFPSATAFLPMEAAPPHFKAYRHDPGADSWTLLGFAFWTTEIEPGERGYNGRIKILVGMDTSGVLTSIIVVQHREPYGYFSIKPPAFAAQFKGKSVRDPFRVGGDIDAVSGATITVTSASRTVRNSARQVARQLLTPETVK